MLPDNIWLLSDLVDHEIGGGEYIYVYVYICFFRASVYINKRKLFYGPKWF